MAQELTIDNIPFNHLYADLSYKEFFGWYYPHRDGRVYAATYSFSHDLMDFWWRLEPTSTLYIDQKYRPQAEGFLRRFPLFEIYSVRRLHSKAVFFERSGVLLLGSENIYEPYASFSELMLETSVPEADRQKVIDLVFRRLKGRILTCQYSVDDIRIHAGSSFSGGRPFLPCHKEIPYWDLIGPPPVLDRPPLDRVQFRHSMRNRAKRVFFRRSSV